MAAGSKREGTSTAKGGSPVRVERTRRGLVLRIGQQHASALRPGKLATGSVWDLLALPLRIGTLPAAPRVLLLGVGGGSVVPLLRAFAPECTIVGVELDADVLRAARESFGIEQHGIELVHGDAIEFLARDRRKWDVVIEDVFGHDGKRLVKPSAMIEPGLARAARKVAKHGLLVSNSVHEAAAARRVFVREFGGGLDLALSDCSNHILVAGRSPPSARELRGVVSAVPEMRSVARRLAIRSFSDPSGWLRRIAP